MLVPLCSSTSQRSSAALASSGVSSARGAPLDSCSELRRKQGSSAPVRASRRSTNLGGGGGGGGALRGCGGAFVCGALARSCGVRLGGTSRAGLRAARLVAKGVRLLSQLCG